MNSDHVPSGAALKKAAEQKLKEMGVLENLSAKDLKTVLNSVYNNATTISVPEDVHKEGRTWGSKNKPHIDDDSKSLKEAFKKDADRIQESMDTKDHGCSDKYREAVKQMENIDFDAEIEKTLRARKAVLKHL